MTFFTVLAFITLSNVVVVPGSAQDGTVLNGTPPGANVNRLGGFGSDLFYDRSSGVFYGLTDRGPGGGVIDYPWVKLRINRTVNFLIRVLFKIPHNDITNADPSYP